MKSKHLLLTIAGLTGLVTLGATPEQVEKIAVSSVRNQEAVQSCLPSIPNFDARNQELPKNIQGKTAEEEAVTIEPPYFNDFSDFSKLDGFSVFDLNGDGSSWGYSSDGKLIYDFSYSNQANDWLVTPKIHLEAGKMYEISAPVWSQYSFFSNEIGIFVGKELNPYSLTETVVPATSITDPATLTGRIVPEESGDYYLGFHITSQPYNFLFVIESFSISKGFEEKAPAAVNKGSVIPDPNARLEAEITFTLPEKAIDGTNVSTINSVTIMNATTGNQVAVVSNPKNTVTVTDNAPVNGINRYEITCSNEYGEGLSGILQGWVGFDIPKAPQNIKWALMEDGQNVIITWDKPEDTGAHGLPIDPEDFLQYTIYGVYGNNQHLLAEWSETSFEATPFISNQQDNVSFMIACSNSLGQSEFGTSNIEPFGKPYDVPFTETFQNGYAVCSPWTVTSYQSSSNWKVITPNYQDWYLAFVGDTDGGSAMISTPMINLASSVKPALMFSFMNADSDMDIDIMASTDKGATWTTISSLENTKANEWKQAIIDLDEWKEVDNVMLGFMGRNNGDVSDVLIKDILVRDNFSYDLKLVSCVLASKGTLYAGAPTPIKVKVENNGLYDYTDLWEINVTADGHTLGSISGQAIASGASKDFTVTLSTAPYNTELSASIVINASLDEYLLNNNGSISLEFEKPWLPAPQNLEATQENSKVILSWTAPEETPIAKPESTTTVDFEDYESWTIGGIEATVDENYVWTVTVDEGQIGDFKVIDADHLGTYALYISGDYPHKTAPMAYTVFDTQNPNDLTSSQKAHSGNKALAAWSSNQGNTDDWLIFPRLGSDKYISFWIRSITQSYGLEEFEIWTSTTGDSTDDFSPLTETLQAPFGDANGPENGFTFFEFDLPDDTEYVAIRHRANNHMGLLIDDITFTAHPGEPGIFIPTGYNVYRNDNRINVEPLLQPDFEDTLETGMNVYTVTAIYDEGESYFSNEVSINTTSVAENVIENEKMFLLYDREITFLMDNMEIISPVGVSIAKGNAGYTVSLAKGVYLICMDSKTVAKIVVI